MSTHVESDLAEDLLFGIEKIAAYLGLGKRQADHQIRAGNIPVKRMGRLVVSRKSALRRHFAVNDGKASAS
jgi:hypothetical protein